jgi:hypothetical protein
VAAAIVEGPPLQKVEEAGKIIVSVVVAKRESAELMTIKNSIHIPRRQPSGGLHQLKKPARADLTCLMR